MRETARSTDSVAGVAISHPDRVLWPEQGLTKRDLAEHYSRVAPLVLPHVADRPLTLVRCLGGHRQRCFVQRNAGPGFGRAIRQVAVRAAEKVVRVPAVEDLEGLVALVQAGVLEIHPWGCTVDHPGHADRMIFDLDPGEGVTWGDVVAAARDLRERLVRLDLAAYVKTTGGKGLHVVVPLRPACAWERVSAFSHALAAGLAEAEPRRFTVALPKAGRRGRIFVDVLRNRRGASAVAPYSPRARPGAPVSMPVEWGALAPGLTPDLFTVATLRGRLPGASADPWASFGHEKQTIGDRQCHAVGVER